MTLKEAREAAGLRQVDVAAELGVHQTAVSLWDCGKKRPKPKNAQRLAELYGVPLEEILAAARQ